MERLDFTIKVWSKFRTDVDQLLLFKPQNDRWSRIKCAERQAFKAFYRSSVGGPDFYASIEHGIGGAEIVFAGNGPQQLRRLFQRVDFIFDLRIGLRGFELKGDDEGAETEIGAHDIDVNLRRIGSNHEFVLTPGDLCLAGSSGESLRLCCPDGDGDVMVCCASGKVPWKLPSPLLHTRKRVGLVAKRVGEPACARAMETTERQQQSADRDARVRDFIGRIAIAKG